MLIKKYFLFLFMVLCCTLSVMAQDFSIQTLKKLNNKELENLFFELKQDSTKAKTIANLIVNKSKKINDTLQIVKGYEYLARISIGEKSIQYTVYSIPKKF